MSFELWGKLTGRSGMPGFRGEIARCLHCSLDHFPIASLAPARPQKHPANLTESQKFNPPNDDITNTLKAEISIKTIDGVENVTFQIQIIGTIEDIHFADMDH